MPILFRRPQKDEVDVCIKLSARLFDDAHKDTLHPDELAHLKSSDVWAKMWKNLLNVPPNSKRVHYLMAYANETPVGYVVSCRNVFNHFPRQAGYLMALYVAPEHQRRGIGRQLIESAFIHCEANIGNAMAVQVLQSDSSVRMIYESYGADYRGSGESKGTIVNSKVDFLLFRDLRTTLIDRFGIMPKRKSILCKLDMWCKLHNLY